MKFVENLHAHSREYIELNCPMGVQSNGPLTEKMFKSFDVYKYFIRIFANFLAEKMATLVLLYKNILL